jgi:hypothetical protein
VFGVEGNYQGVIPKYSESIMGMFEEVSGEYILMVSTGFGVEIF